MKVVELFKEALGWLGKNYRKFYTERDIVWTIQKHLIRVIKRKHLPYKVFNDYPIIYNKPASIRRN